MIEIYLLEQLTTFARTGTLSRAAEELHISQPAMSQSMKKIEDEFGLSLFDRDKSKITLNSTGKTAAKYAERVLEANREMIEMTFAFDRKKRTIVLGSCSSFPSRKLMPILQEHFGEMAITSVIVNNDRLISGLKDRIYQLVVLHNEPNDPDIFYQQYIKEQLCISVPEEHPLASRKTVSFQDFAGTSILANGDSGFWLDICRQNMNESNLLVQKNLQTLKEVVGASSLPVFNSTQMLERGHNIPGRVTIPISDDSVRITYYLACLKTEKRRYQVIFNSARSSATDGRENSQSENT